MDLNKLDLLEKELRSIELYTVEKPDSLNNNIISKFTEVSNRYKTKGNPNVDTFVITYRDTLKLIADDVFKEAKRGDIQSRLLILNSLYDTDIYLDEILEKVNAHKFQSNEKLNPISFYRDISPCLVYANKVIEEGIWDMRLVNDIWETLFDRKIVSRDLISSIEKLIENQNNVVSESIGKAKKNNTNLDTITQKAFNSAKHRVNVYEELFKIYKDRNVALRNFEEKAFIGFTKKSLERAIKVVYKDEHLSFNNYVNKYLIKPFVGQNDGQK